METEELQMIKKRKFTQFCIFKELQEKAVFLKIATQHLRLEIFLTSSSGFWIFEAHCYIILYFSYKKRLF